VVHLDLRHRSNVLLGDDGHPVLLDFATALHLRPERLAGRLLLPVLRRFDRGAVDKWRDRLASGPGAQDSGASRAAPSGSGGASDGARGASRPT
jgi:hypothetical protein